MSDWLDEIDSIKQQFVEQQQAELMQQEQAKIAKFNRLRDDHNTMIKLIQNTNVESIFLQLAQRAIPGNPQYSNATLARELWGETTIPIIHEGKDYGIKVFSTSLDGYLWRAKIASGDRYPVSPLPRDFSLKEGYFLSEIRWTLWMFDKTADKSFHMYVSIKAIGLSINFARVDSLDLESIQRALILGFKRPLSGSGHKYKFT
jgi:hypothetical protein